VLGVSSLIFFSFFSYYRLSFVIFQQNQQTQLTNRIRNIESNYRYIRNLLDNLAYNDDIQKHLLNESIETQIRAYQDAMSVLVNTQSLENYIIDIGVINKSGAVINITGDSAFFRDLQNEIPENQITYFFPDKKTYLVQSNLTSCIVVGQRIYPLDLSDPDAIGSIFLVLDPAQFFGLYTQDNNQALFDTIVIDAGDELLLGSDNIYNDYLQLADANDEQFTDSFQIHNLPELPFIMAASTRNESLRTEMLKIAGNQYLFAFILLAAIIVVFYLLISKLNTPIKQITRIMKRITSGNRKALKERIPVDNDSMLSEESVKLISTFNSMLDEIESLNQNIFSTYSKIYEAELYAKKTELALLRSQINPHFIYNTLALICGMSTENRTEDIVNITQAIAKILRYSVKGEELVKLSDELDIIKSYLMIQQCRFDDRFKIEYKIFDNTLDAVIPKMILQPIVENAIIHGLEKKIEDGILEIGALVDSRTNHLVIWVYDTGVGMNQSKLNHLRQAIKYSSNTHDYMSEQTPEHVVE
jgi:two-component system sensor histidine kinase YesM